MRAPHEHQTPPLDSLLDTPSALERKRLELEVDIMAEGYALGGGVLDLGNPTHLTCPECHGTLLEIREGQELRYRCHTGHGFSKLTLLSSLGGSVEALLWQAMRSLEESSLLLERLARHALDVGQAEKGQGGVARAALERKRARAVQKLVGHLSRYSV